MIVKNKKPRLLLVVQLPPPYHGVTVANDRLVNSCQLEARFEVEILPIRVADSISDLGRFSFDKLTRVIGDFIRMYRALRNADLVYYTPGGGGLTLLRDALMMSLCRVFRVPYVLHMHNGRIGLDKQNHPFPFYLNLALRNFMPQASHIILLGDSVYDGYKGYMGVDQPFSSVGNGFDLGSMKCVLPKGPVRLGYINNLIRKKGVAHAIQCLGRLPDVHMDIVGEFYQPDYEAEIRAEIAKLNLENRIHFHGAIYGDAAWDKLASCHIILYTSDWQEGFPLVWLEAMARGKIVVTSRIGVADDVIGRVDKKLVQPVADSTAMAEVIQELCKDRAELERLSQAGLDLVANEFTVNAWAQRVVHALERSVADKCSE